MSLLEINLSKTKGTIRISINPFILDDYLSMSQPLNKPNYDLDIINEYFSLDDSDRTPNLAFLYEVPVRFNTIPFEMKLFDLKHNVGHR